MCKMAGDTTYFMTYAYGSWVPEPRPVLDFTYGYLILEQEGEQGDLKVKYGKQWLMEKKANKNEVIDHGFAFMKYPHHHGECDAIGHWNPDAQPYRDSIDY